MSWKGEIHWRHLKYQSLCYCSFSNFDADGDKFRISWSIPITWYLPFVSRATSKCIALTDLRSKKWSGSIYEKRIQRLEFFRLRTKLPMINKQKKEIFCCIFKFLTSVRANCNSRDQYNCNWAIIVVIQMKRKAPGNDSHNMTKKFSEIRILEILRLLSREQPNEKKSTVLTVIHYGHHSQGGRLWSKR